MQHETISWRKNIRDVAPRASWAPSPCMGFPRHLVLAQVGQHLTRAEHLRHKGCEWVKSGVLPGSISCCSHSSHPWSSGSQKPQTRCGRDIYKSCSGLVAYPLDSLWDWLQVRYLQLSTWSTVALVARSTEGRGSAGGECGPSCSGTPLPSHHSGLLVDSLRL